MIPIIKDYLATNKKQISLVWGSVRKCINYAGRITKESGPMHYVDIAVQIYDELRGLRNSLALCLSNEEEWETVYPIHASLYSEYVKIFKLSNIEISDFKVTFNSDKTYKKATIGEIEIIWCEEKNTTNGTVISNFKTRKNQSQLLKKELPMLFEKVYGKHINVYYDSNKHKLNFLSNKNFVYVENDLAKQYAETIKKYRDKGYGRSYLFYGPPGTGKSNLSKSIAAELQYRTMSFENLEVFLEYFSDSFFNSLISLLDIGVIIMDDLDSLASHRSNHILRKIEELRHSGKILIATANQIKKMNPALIRVGRFDKIQEIKYLDPDVVFEMVGEDTELFELVKKYPVASIRELMIRVEVEGREQAKKDLGDILKRAQTLQEVDFEL